MKENEKGKKKKSGKLEEFTYLITQIMEKLIDADFDKSQKLLIELPVEPIDLIAKLDNYPRLQLCYAEDLLKEEGKSPRKRLPDHLKLKYLRQKCQREPDLVACLLKTYKFPLDEALKICTEYKNYFGSAYIKSRLGLQKEALKEYLIVSFTPKKYF